MRPQIETPTTDDVDAIEEAWLRERPGTPVDSIGVITRIWRIARLLDQDRRRTMARLHLDASTRDLLSTLRRAGAPYELTPSELAARSLVSQSAISQRITRAESRGLVTRRRAEGDGRGVVVALTEAGHDVIERSVDELLRHEDDLLSSLDSEQRRQLAGLLRILMADLTRRVAD